MPYLLSRPLLALALWLAATLTPGWAAAAAGIDALVLGNGNTQFELDEPVPTWLDSNERTTVQEVASNPKNFVPTPALQRHALTANNRLWIHLRLVRAAGNTERWVLNIPLPFVDQVTLYQRRTDGSWATQSAGDQLPQSAWAKRGLYPEFELDLPSGVPQDLYLQVRNFKHLSIPLRLATSPEREAQRLLEVISLGLVLGTLITLAALSIIRHLEYRNRVDMTAALYGLLIAASVAQINGVLNALLWSNTTTWADYANSVMPALAVGASLLFVRRLYALSTHFHHYDKALGFIAWTTLGSVLTYVVLDRPLADQLGAAVLFVATTAGLGATVLSWRSGSQIGTWLLLAYVPQFLVLLRLVAEAFGLAPTFWQLRYLMSMGVALSVPALIYALSRATHDRKELALRAEQLPTQDALTGLLTEQTFQSHLGDAYQRAVDNREPTALVLVSVINLEHIRASRGNPIAEQCLLRAVIKLHRILRDVDPAARMGTDRFAMLLEGVASRQALTERLVKLVASGLVPLQGLQPEVTLQFQAACVLLHDNPVPADRVMQDLSKVLASISPRTRRPIRFLEPVPTLAAPLGGTPETP
ncbi:7TM-DISM domain-containing protein [Rhodoferax saidenbachensis]|uniref:GGDEF domain-containing protein n=1 Tax=Rhodoferax saidenbachensis TaxID=1484693 RepID=A0ABU1ZK23_9BURK|nr:7TM-DISM domain-containing protein [Rhodoferax saidenbachensis]MDR7305901.1 GGDEF domain-containing protein [Rhodoferax saidenbachensis]